MQPGSGYEFKSEIKGGAVPKEYIPGVMKGLEECMSNGVLAGYPVVDVRAVLVDGSYHDVDSSVLAFQLAARGAFRDGVRKAGPRLLEPIMKVEVVTPEDHLGDVIGDLNSRRGQINNFGDKPGGLKVNFVNSMLLVSLLFFLIFDLIYWYCLIMYPVLRKSMIEGLCVLKGLCVSKRNKYSYFTW